MKILSFILLLLELVALQARKDYERSPKSASTSEKSRNDLEDEGRRRLSSKTDMHTSESLVTYNGQVPQVTCPKGYYRPQGSTNLEMVTGQRKDGCVRCPKGVYGETKGLTSPLCTAPCPLGRYSDREGIKSALECNLCPIGTYGSAIGLTTRDCSGKCPLGKYSNKLGMITINDCKTCLPGYRMWQCPWAIQPRRGQDQDHQHREYPGYGLPIDFKDPIPFKK